MYQNESTLYHVFEKYEFTGYLWDQLSVIIVLLAHLSAYQNSQFDQLNLLKVRNYIVKKMSLWIDYKLSHHSWKE